MAANSTPGSSNTWPAPLARCLSVLYSGFKEINLVKCQSSTGYELLSTSELIQVYNGEFPTKPQDVKHYTPRLISVCWGVEHPDSQQSESCDKDNGFL